MKPYTEGNFHHQIECRSQRELLSMPDADVSLYPSFFGQQESDDLLQELLAKVEWRRDAIKIYGRQIPLPRLTAWYGDEGKSYTYSQISMDATPWTPALLAIKARIETVARGNFNSDLLKRC